MAPYAVQAKEVRDKDLVRHFESQVRPLLLAKCAACHGADEQEADLRLDRADDFFQGGKSGPVVVAGKPEESLLLTAVRRVGELKMPPDEKLSPAEIAVLEKWIAGGAVWPEYDQTDSAHETGSKAVFSDEQKSYWAFQPVRQPQLPDVQDLAWCDSPVDQFVLNKLEVAELRPAQPAARRTLIRRLFFDLIGLPPSPKEIDDFLADESPVAFERLVDRLLASPHYGERWGRHWLDVARYSDTTGQEADWVMRFAYRYRDYVIESLNRDKPYDRFIVEQLAGDLLPETQDVQLETERLSALGFLMLSPKATAEADKELMVLDVVDEQIDVTGRAFLGLTIACARCHDHKFDPIPTMDYYSIAGIFRSTETMVGLDKGTSNWVEFPLEALFAEQSQVVYDEFAPKIQAVEHELAARADEAGEALARWEQEIREAGKEAFRAPDDMVVYCTLDRDTLDTPNGSVQIKAVGNVEWTEGRVGKALQLAGKGHIELGAVAGLERTDHFSYGAWVYPTAEGMNAIVAKMDDGDANSRGWDLWFRDGRVYVHLIHQWNNDGGNAIRVNTDRVLPLNQWYHVMATYDGSSKAAGVKIYVDGKLEPVTATHDTLTGTLQTDKPVTIGQRAEQNPFHGKIDDVRIYNRELKPEEVALLAAGFPAEIFGRTPDQRSEEQQQVCKQFYLQWYDAPYRQLLAQLDETKLAQEKRIDELGKPMVMAVREQQEPADLHVYIRGDYNQKGPLAPRRYLQIVAGEGHAPIQTEQSGRLELARWIADPTNPLTARVMVNRMWQGHFGTGMVPSSDNFGKLGGGASHPELLDWLAIRLVEYNWSLKSVHRVMVNTSTYRQAWVENSAAERLDPSNRLHWRRDRRRLEAEPIRDAMLVVNERLDHAIGNEVLPDWWVEAEIVVDADAGLTALAEPAGNLKAYQSNRRAVYLPVSRNQLYEMFRLFDYADASSVLARRIESTVAPQALFMLNSDFVIRQAERFAEALLDSAAHQSDEDRLRLAHVKAFGRLPNVQELSEAVEALSLFVDDQQDQERTAAEIELAAWQDYCHVLFCQNEFIYVE